MAPRIITSTGASGVLEQANRVTILNPFPSDATKYLDGTGAYTVPPGTGTGTVTTTGSPASGNLSKFSGGSSITSGDLSGDISTSGTLVTTIGAAKVTEAMQTLANNTTNNVSTSKHGYAPILPNDATKYLDGTGGYTIPAGTGTSGALVLLEQHSASSSATLNFTTAISSTYDEYMIEFVNVLPETDGVTFSMRVGTGAGPTYDTGSNYSSRVWIFAGGSTVETNLGATSIFVSRASTVGNDSRWGIVGSIKVFSPGSGSVRKMHVGQIFYEQNATGGFEQDLPMGSYDSLTAVTAWRFYFSSGNIASGTIRAYGIAK